MGAHLLCTQKERVRIPYLPPTFRKVVMIKHDDGGVTLTADEWKAIQLVSNTAAKVFEKIYESVDIITDADTRTPDPRPLFNTEMVN